MMGSNFTESMTQMTPTIREELEEEVEYERAMELGMEKQSSGAVMNTDSANTSFNGDSIQNSSLRRNNSRSNNNIQRKKSYSRLVNSSVGLENQRSNSTITFEKVKIIPKSRTQSEQSVLSSLSLKSLLDNRINAKQMKRNDSSNTNLSTSVRHTLNASTSSTDQDSEIGLQLPFTDDKGMALEDFKGNSSDSLNRVRTQDSQSDTSTVSTVKTTIEDDANLEEEVLSSHDLTTHALRKLSVLKIGNNNIDFGNNSNSIPSSNDMDEIPATTTIEQQQDEESELDDDDDQTLRIGRSASNFTTKTEIATTSPRRELEKSPLRTRNDSLTQGQSHINSKVNLMTLKDNNIHNNTNNNSINNNNNKLHNELPSQLPKQTPSNFNPMIQNNISNFNPMMQNNSSNFVRQPTRHFPSEDMIRKPNLYQTGSTNSIMTNSSHVSNANASKPKKFIKQINNPKKPLYVPAVLRNVAETNLTNEDFQDGGHHGAASIAEQQDEFNDIVSNASARDYLAHYSNNYESNSGSRINSQSSIHSTASSLYDTYKQKFSELVTYYNGTTPSESDMRMKPRPPTRAHWVPDAQRSNCRKCRVRFSMMERRHHCRHCGEIFCVKDVSESVYLNSEAKFCQLRQFGGGMLVKVCHDCWLGNEKYMQDIKLSKLRRMEELQQQSNDSDDLIPMRRKIGSRGVDDRRESVAGSVPVDWNWSSF